MDSEAFKPNKELTDEMKEKARNFGYTSGVWLALFPMFQKYEIIRWVATREIDDDDVKGLLEWYD